MCLSFVDAFLDGFNSVCPCKRKRNTPEETYREDIDRDNVDLPFVVIEKKDLPDDKSAAIDNAGGSSSPTTVTTRKVSSLALI